MVDHQAGGDSRLGQVTVELSMLLCKLLHS